MLSMRHLRNFRTYLVSPEKYAQDVKDRETTLLEIGFTREQLQGKIPQQYNGVSGRALLDAVSAIQRLPALERKLRQRNLTNFILQGNIEQNRFTPWQLSGTARLMGKSVEKLKELPPVSKIGMFRKAKAAHEWGQ